MSVQQRRQSFAPRPAYRPVPKRPTAGRARAASSRDRHAGAGRPLYVHRPAAAQPAGSPAAVRGHGGRLYAGAATRCDARPRHAIGREHSVGDLRDESMPERDGLCRVALDSAALGELRLGDLKLLFQFVKSGPPAAPPDPAGDAASVAG